MSEQPVFIIGHKNPDADSICSAIGYSAYKNALGFSEFFPARCGNSNPRIDAILKRFETPLPLFIGDVTPRVKNIMKGNPHFIKETDTCSYALSLMDDHDYRALPVVDDNQVIKGLVTIFGLGDYFTPRMKNPLDMRRVNTRVADIIGCLEAKEINVTEPEKVEELFVRVGAMDIRSFDRSSKEIDIPSSSSIVVVGDRWDIQEKCIQMGVRLIVITGGLEVDQDVQKHARENGVSIIVSPHDTATTSWIIRSSTQVSHVMEPESTSFVADDRLSAVKRRILENNAPLFVVKDSEGRLQGVFSKTDLLRPITTRLVLVDHNEMNQAVDGAREVQIIEIIDHHRLGSFSTEQPILFVNEPVGSTSTIVANMFRTRGLKVDSKIAGILMAGIISDTLNLNSPTTTEVDHDVLGWLHGEAGHSIEELADLVFQSGSVISSQQPAEVIEADCKQYPHGEINFSVSQIEELGFDHFWKCWESLAEALEAYREKNGLYFSTLLVTDINRQDSLLLFAGSNVILESISYPKTAQNNIFEMKSVVSRKKQLIPYLSSILKSVGIEH